MKSKPTTLEFSPPKALFATRIQWMEIQAVAHHYAAAPDGQRFLIISATDEAQVFADHGRAQLDCGFEGLAMENPDEMSGLSTPVGEGRGGRHRAATPREEAGGQVVAAFSPGVRVSCLACLRTGHPARGAPPRPNASGGAS